MRKISKTNCPQMDRTASDEYVGVQTFMEIKDEQLVEVQLEENNLLELLLSPSNLNAAYRQVVRNGGVGGVDKMETSELLPYLTLPSIKTNCWKRYAGGSIVRPLCAG